MAVLVWIWTRNDLNRSFLPMITTLLILANFRSVLIEALVQVFSLNSWVFLLFKGVFTLVIACFSLQLYVGFVDSS